MMLHVVTGTVAVASGGLALAVRKGETVHRWAGMTFFLTMTISAAAGAWAAFIKPEMITVLAGLFTIYLVATSWGAAHRPDRTTGLGDVAGAVAALGIGAAGVFYGLQAQTSATGLVDGYPAEPYFVFGGLALSAGLLDAAVLIRKGIGGAQRIARHLWRMCLALFIAVGSLFTGPGATAFPDAWQGSPLLSAPELIVFVLLIVWLVRVLFFWNSLPR